MTLFSITGERRSAIVSVQEEASSKTGGDWTGSAAMGRELVYNYQFSANDS